MGNDWGIQGVSAMQEIFDKKKDTNLQDGDIVIWEERCLGYINLRLRADDKEAQYTVNTLLGCDLPPLNYCAANDKLKVLCYSPSEWILITPSGEEKSLLATLQTSLTCFHHLATDISGGTTTLNIEGKLARHLLEKGTYVDLDSEVFLVNQLYTTQLAGAPVTIVKKGNNNFSLIVRRSFAYHIADWVIDAGTTFTVFFR